MDRRVGFGWDNRPIFRLGRVGRLELRTRFQEDFRRSDALPEGQSWLWAMRRVGVGGQIAGRFDFELTAEAGLDNPWRDVYVNYRQFQAVQVQAGKFKLPFGLDQLTGATVLELVYRSRIGDQLSPGRDRGVMVHGRLFNRAVGYQAGVFDHDGGNARTTDPARVIAGTTFAGRVVALPLRSTKTAFADLQVGGGLTLSNVDEGLLGLRGRTALRQVFFSPAIPVNGLQQRVGIDAQWRPGPFSVKTEYIHASVERNGQSATGGDLAPIHGRGWYLMGSWAVTGERKAVGVDVPQRPLFGGGIGAIEVAARIEELAFASAVRTGIPSTDPRADQIAGNTDRIETVGVNWFPNQWMKVQFNLIHETIDDPTTWPVPGVDTLWTRVLRLQFKF